MAVNKYQYLDKAGTQRLAEAILKEATNKISSIIDTTLVGPGSDKKVPSVKALLNKLGENGIASTKTAFGQIKYLQDTIGHKTDSAEDATVYGAIAEAKEFISESMSEAGHIQYQLLKDGKVTSSNPSVRNTNTLYLQHDSDEDKTYEIYIWTGPNNSSGNYYNGEDDGIKDNTEDKWICVGNVELDLVGYWQKTDEGVRVLQEEMLRPMPVETVEKLIKETYAEIHKGS